MVLTRFGVIILQWCSRPIYLGFSIHGKEQNKEDVSNLVMSSSQSNLAFA